MNYRIYLAALLLAGFACTATPAAAQGYAGVLPSESADSSDDGALPFMSTQMGAPAGGSQANVTEAAGNASGGETDNDAQASAEGADGTDGAAPDPSDLYGLNGDTTLSTDEQNQPAGKSGYMAMIGEDEKSKGPKRIDDGYVDDTPADLYRSMEGAGTVQSESEKARLRLNRQLEAARIEHDKEIDAMNAARTRDNQIRAQEEMDRITAIQQEALTKVREANGTATEGDYEALNEVEPPEIYDNGGDVAEGAGGSVEGAESEESLISDDSDTDTE